MTEPDTEAEKSPRHSRQQGAGSDILCVCFGVTRTDVRNYMSRPNCSVDDMIGETRIGTKCTACLLDLDITLNDIQLSRHAGSSQQDSTGNLEISYGEGPVEHLDSAFFVCDGDVRTVVRMANFTPMFEDGPEAIDHKFEIWLMGEDGKIAGKTHGMIGANQQTEVDLSQVHGCPSRGWFLLSCFPMGPGFYGTLRPQGLLVGDGWASSYHCQPHHGASNKYRRLSIVIKTMAHKTNSSVFVFNGERVRSDISIELDSRESDFHAQSKAVVAGNGLCVVDLDKEFSSLPEREIMLLTINSNTITKKYIATIQPNGQWSADHFPTLP